MSGALALIVPELLIVAVASRVPSTQIPWAEALLLLVETAVAVMMPLLLIEAPAAKSPV